MINQRTLRQVMGQFATGVTIVTTKTKEGNYGFTANSFTSVSLAPPLVLFCLNKASEGCQLFLNSQFFAVNILAAHQIPISNQFANNQLSAGERFKGVEYSAGKTGSPILKNTLGWLDCELHAYHDGGDHWIFVGKVIDMARSETGQPLLYYGGGYRTMNKK